MLYPTESRKLFNCLSFPKFPVASKRWRWTCQLCPLWTSRHPTTIIHFYKWAPYHIKCAEVNRSSMFDALEALCCGWKLLRLILPLWWCSFQFRWLKAGRTLGRIKQPVSRFRGKTNIKQVWNGFYLCFGLFFLLCRPSFSSDTSVCDPLSLCSFPWL